MKTSEEQRVLFVLGIFVSLFPSAESSVMWFFVIYAVVASFPLLFVGNGFLEHARKFACDAAPLGAGQLCVVGFVEGMDRLAGLLIFAIFIPFYMLLLRMVFAKFGGGNMPSVSPTAYWKYYLRRTYASGSTS